MDSKRYPLSLVQEWFLTLGGGEEVGPFGGRYLIVSVLRITGRVDVAVLQGALDDVVARHELLRTVVVRDADPPYQLVCPPCRVPLEVRDLNLPATGGSREAAVQEVMAEAHAETISAREVPLLRGLLCRFDDQDSALYLTVHHSVCDGWSVQVILRDLGAFYAARTAGTAPALPEARQYREYAEWQRATAASSGDEGALEYWAGKLDGAREFVMPNDHGHPGRYAKPYSLHVFGIDAQTMAAAAAMAAAARGTRFMVMLSAFYVLASQITGATDLTLNAVTSGRDDLRFHDTMGMFLNTVPFRTEIGDCASFRDVVMKTRETFIDAMAHELPIGVLEQAFPGYMHPREDTRVSQVLIMQPPSQYGQIVFPIAGGAAEVDEVLLEQDQSSSILGGTEWHLNGQPDGSVSGSVHFNRGEFEESTVKDWTAGFRRILAGAARDPDQDWRYR